MGSVERPKASKRAVGVSGRMERAEVSLSRSDIVAFVVGHCCYCHMR